MSVGTPVILILLLSLDVEQSSGHSNKTLKEGGNKLIRQTMLTRKYFGGTVDPALYKDNDHSYEEIRTPFKHRGLQEIPENFDARTQWPDCKSIKRIPNQGLCGSCWAVAAASAMSDRVCVASKGKIHFEFSADDILTCCGDDCFGNPSDPCGGGKANKAWQFWSNNGVVSGGEYKSDQGCKPYTEQSFLNHSALPCKKQCTNREYKGSYPSNKRYGTNFFIIRSRNVKEIQRAIMKGGPLEGFLDVYEDLLNNYTDTIYTCPNRTSKQPMGHSVKMIGWGVENRVPYWLVANTWGPKWGKLDGFFKILRGKNECRIEFYLVGGYPNLKHFGRSSATNESKHTSSSVSPPASPKKASASAVISAPCLMFCLLIIPQFVGAMT